MDLPSHCPKCKEHLQGEDIYEFFLDQYGDHEKALESAECYGWSDENKVKFSNWVGIYCLEKDMTTHYECPYCKHHHPVIGFK